MGKHSVDVIIKAKDQASKKFAKVGFSAGAMAAAIKAASAVAGWGVGKLTDLVKYGLVKAYEAAKRAALAFAAAAVYSGYAAIRQEAAEIELASALKVTGQYTEENFLMLKAYAAELQKQSTYGDEYVMTLERMAISLGWTAEQAGAAAKAAIALHAGFGGGRGKPEIFLRYYTDAINGNTSALATYIVTLRSAKTEQEKQKILQDALNKGWDVAASKAQSTGGVLKQTWNIIGDTAEVIGKPFLEIIRDSALAVQKWAIDNRAAIALWAEKVASYATLVKDIFASIVKFMQEDWRAGMRWAFDSFLKLLQTTFNSAIKLSLAAGEAIAKGMILGMIRFAAKSPQYAARGAKVIWDMLHGRKTTENAAGVEGEIAGLFGDLKDDWSAAFKDIMNDLPPNIRQGVEEAMERHRQRLMELQKWPTGAGVDTSGWPTGTGPLGKAMRHIRQQLSPNEAGMLTFAPGTRFGKTVEEKTADATGKTEKNTKELCKLTQKVVNGVHALGEQLRQNASVNVVASDFA